MYLFFGEFLVCTLFRRLFHLYLFPTFFSRVSFLVFRVYIQFAIFHAYPIVAVILHPMGTFYVHPVGAFSLVPFSDVCFMCTFFRHFFHVYPVPAFRGGGGAISFAVLGFSRAVSPFRMLFVLLGNGASGSNIE